MWWKQGLWGSLSEELMWNQWTCCLWMEITITMPPWTIWNPGRDSCEVAASSLDTIFSTQWMMGSQMLWRIFYVVKTPLWDLPLTTCIGGTRSAELRQVSLGTSWNILDPLIGCLAQPELQREALHDLVAAPYNSWVPRVTRRSKDART